MSTPGGGGCSRMIPRATGGSPVASARWCLRPSHSAMSLCASLQLAAGALRASVLRSSSSTYCFLRWRDSIALSRLRTKRARFLSSLSSSFSAAVAASAFCVANVGVRRPRRGGRRKAARGDGRLRRRGRTSRPRPSASRPRRRGGNRRRGRPRARRGAEPPATRRRGRRAPPAAGAEGGLSNPGTPRARDTARGEKRRNGRCLATWWASSRAWRAVAVMKGKAGCGGQTRAVKVGWARCAARERRPSAFIRAHDTLGRKGVENCGSIRDRRARRRSGTHRTAGRASVATSRVAAPASAVPEAGGMLRAPHDCGPRGAERLEHRKQRCDRWTTSPSSRPPE